MCGRLWERDKAEKSMEIDLKLPFLVGMGCPRVEKWILNCVSALIALWKYLKTPLGNLGNFLSLKSLLII